MVIGSYDFKAVEEEILDFWKKNEIYSKVKAKGKGKKHFYFLDGPPYTSGKIHLGHAWNKSLKDSVLRFKRMQGFDVWDRAGYDMHGLPTEHATEKKLGIKGKEEIEKYGVDKFIEECRKLCIHYRDEMSKDFSRMGVWMDFENAYQPITSEFIEGEWWLIKKAHENRRLYEGLRTTTWCAHDATALAKHELEYKNVKDDSVYLKFKIKGTNEYIIVWTTTPWTIPFNEAVMANPDIDYVKAKVEDEVWIIAKALTAFIPAVANKKFTIIEEVKGEKLEGLKYEHPLKSEIKEFDEIEGTSPKLHTVVLSSEYVDASAGSGLVHCAPGCGPEDYEVGHRNGLPAFNELDEHGKFKSSMGKYSGWRAKVDDVRFIEELNKKGVLIATSPVEHEYPHCWRCKKPVVFRTTKQWFFKIEDLKENMRELNRSICWVPDYAGSRQFDSWLANLRDNSITRQRYWGTPVPIWRCSTCDNYEVIGSREELKKKTGKLPEDLHKPSLENLTIKCSCGKQMKRIPDVLDVWIDSATASWNCLDYPGNDKLFKEMFPPDLILEGNDQIRGWFNILFVASMTAMNKPAYKSVYMHGFTNQGGEKMSKSLGNAISPKEIIDQYGSDTMRYYLIRGTNPGLDLNFSQDDMKVSFRNLGVLWNLHKLLVDLSNAVGKNPEKIKSPKLDIEEKFILSKLNSALKNTTKAFEEYRLNEVPHYVEDLFLELSRTYIQLVREKSAVGSEKEKEAVLYTISEVLMNILKMFSPISPFITEKMYLNLKEAFKLKESSIHLFDWPKFDPNLIDVELEASLGYAKYAIQSILSSREKIKRGVRWPVSEVVLVSDKEDVLKALKKTQNLIASQTNVKKLAVSDSFAHAKLSLKPDFSKIGPAFGKKAASILAKLITMPALNEKIQKEGKATIMIDAEKFELKKEHFTVEHALPKDWVSSEFPSGTCYLNAETNKDLEAEGVAREVMRKVQTLRKDSGLQRKDEISLFIETDDATASGLIPFKSMISERCGAKNLKFSGQGKFELSDKIKNKEIKISFNKI